MPDIGGSWGVRGLIAVASLLASCGGGGDDDWLFPLWISTDVAIADLEGDGRNDVLTLAQLATSMSQKEGRLVVYRQTSAGVFASPVTYGVGVYPWNLAVGDVSADNRPDLVVTDVDGQSAWLLLADPSNPGQFLPPQQIAAGLLPYGADIGDLNGDGSEDIVLGDARRDANRLVLRCQDPAKPGALLPAVDVAQPATATDLVTGELNGDDRTDLLTHLALGPTGFTPNGVLATTFQQPGGTLGLATTLAPHTGLINRHLAIADFNGDGRNDLFAFFTPSSTSFTAKLTVLLQDSAPAGPGQFSSPPVDTSLGGVPGIDDAVVSDLNANGQPDAALVGFFPTGSNVESRVNVLFSAASGVFNLAGAYSLPVSASRIAAGDIDGDGRNDLVVLGGENQVLVLIQSHATPGIFEAPRALP